MPLRGTATAVAPLHLGIVHGERSIHFVAASQTGAALMHRLAEYVGRRAEEQLYPEDSWLLGRLLRAGESEAAVRFYFERVGERWDHEWLEQVTVSIAAPVRDPVPDA